MIAPVSVIIPNWNGARLLEIILERLASQTYPIAEVLVVDNGSQDDSAKVARKGKAGLIQLDSNTGFSGAVNRGLEASSSPWIVIINNDVEPEPHWLETLLDRARSVGAWFATGKLLAARDHTRIDGTWDAICRGAATWRCGSGRPDGDTWNTERPIRFAPLTAALFRRELFDQIGLLDEAFESYLEDADLALRCATKGFTGVYVPNAVAYHQGSATLGPWNPETVRRIARNQILLVAKHYSRNSLLRSLWPIFVAQALWGLVALRHGAGWAYCRGKWQGLAGFRRARKYLAPIPFDILRESEREILELQRRAGFDAYWRLYFTFT